MFLVALTGKCYGGIQVEMDSIKCVQWVGIEESNPPCLPAAQLDSFLQARLSEFKVSGYLAASVDSVQTTSDHFIVFFYQGPKFQLNKIRWDSLVEWNQMKNEKSKIETLLNSSGYPSKFTGIIIRELANMGYPKAKVKVTPLFISKDEYDILISIAPGPLVAMDDIVLQGDSILSTRFLRSYLFWKKDEPFAKEIFDDVAGRLTNLPYAKLKKAPELGLEYDKAQLILALGKEKANVFDFILGVLPSGGDQDRKVIFSVYLNTVLHNTLKQGEKLSVKFVNTKPKTQELNIDIEYPYISSWPFGLVGGMQLYRDEDTHIDLKYRVGSILQTFKRTSVTLYWERNSSSLLNPDTTSLIQELKLPDELDFVTNRLGLSARYEDVDYIFAPRKGVITEITATAGQKKIQRNQSLLNYEGKGIEVGKLYDSLGANQIQLELKHDLQYHLRLSKRLSVAWMLKGQYFLSDQKLLLNELYRIGGSNLLRGFDEQFFSVNQYSMMTNELRYFIDRRSYFSAFIDVAYLRRNTLNSVEEGWVNGFGLGMNFQTTVGLFNLNYALGSGLGIPFDISRGKIHFGYVSLF